MKTATKKILQSAVAFGIALLVGCAAQTTTQNRESMLMAAGFKVITPKTDAQKQKLQNLPAGMVTKIQKRGKPYYVLPDTAHNQAYVGGPKQYEEYLQLRAEKKLAREDVQSAEMYQDSVMEWSMWSGGEGVWGPMAGPGAF